jgi:FkbM family methyltransferase
MLARALRAYLRSGLRGGTRTTFALARHVPSLRRVPISIGTTIIHVDLRDAFSHELLIGAPWAGPPLEEDEQAIMRGLIRPGEVAIDVGAHIGLHSALLAELVGRSGVVHVFEPNPRRYAALSATVARHPNTTLHTMGLSDSEGVVTLFIPVEDESMSSLLDWTEGRIGAIEQTTCEVRTLDALIRDGIVPAADFIKCDVEGAERRVFEGARDALDRVEAPCVMYEANARSAGAFGETVSAATEWLALLAAPSFRFFHVQPRGTLAPVPPTLHTRDDHFNLLAVPAARSDRLS